MSFFDDIKAKAEEVLGGTGEDLSNTLGDAPGNITDITDQVQDSILGGSSEDNNSEQ